MNAAGVPVPFIQLKAKNPDLDWHKLKNTFRKFGIISKLYVDKDKKFASIYYSDESSAALACEELSSCEGWNLILKTGTSNGNLKNGNCMSVTESGSDRLSINSSNSHNIMEEACTVAGEYVDLHGRSVDVLADENGHLFVSMDDIEAAGFKIYRKEEYDAISIPKNLEVREFYNYLLGRAQDYMLKFRQPFDPDEIVNIIDRVAAKLGIKETVPNQFTPPAKNTFFSSEQGNISQERVAAKLGIKETVPNQFAPPAKNTFFSSEHGKISQERVAAKLGIKETVPNQFAPSAKNPSFSSEHGRISQERVAIKQGIKETIPKQFAEPLKNASFPTENGKNSQRWVNAKVELEEEPRNQSSFVNNTKNTFSSTEKSRHSNSVQQRQDKSVDSSKQYLKNWSEVRQSKSAGRNESGKRELKSDVNNTGKNSVSPKPHKPLVDDPKTDTPCISRLPLVPGTNYKIKVSYLNPEKPNIFYGQLQEAVAKVQDIVVELNSEIEIDQPDIRKPLIGMLCLAKYEDIWYRAVVFRESLVLGQCVVELMDYGNIEEINTFVKKMPEKLAKIPAQAIRFTLDVNEQAKLEVDQDIEVYVKKQFEPMTYLVTITKLFEKEEEWEEKNLVKPVVTDTKKVEEPKEDCFPEVVSNSIKVVPGDTFRISSYSDEKLAVHNKASIAILKSIYSQIKDIQKQRIKNPQVGQMVLCAKDGDEGLHRAIIRDINNKVANVEFVDYAAQESLALTSLRNVDEDLASLPSVKIEIDYPILGKLNEKGIELLNNLISQKYKLESVLHNNNIDFIMPDTRVRLSDKIKELLRCTKESKTDSIHSPRSGSANNQKSIIKCEDIPEAVVELGLAEYSCYTCTNEGVTLVSMSQENMSYLEKIIGYFPEQEPYTPEPFEMCLVYYLDLWARGMVVSIENDVFEIYFIDYGNNDHVKREDIRQFPKDFLEIPITGFFASFTGIEKTPAVLRRLQELLSDGTIVEADVKSKNGDTYNVEFPSVYGQLRKEKLLK